MLEKPQLKRGCYAKQCGIWASWKTTGTKPSNRKERQYWLKIVHTGKNTSALLFFSGRLSVGFSV